MSDIIIIGSDIIRLALDHTCPSQTRAVLVVRARISTSGQLPALSGSWSMRPCHLSPIPTLLWRVPPRTGSPCPLRNLARIPGSHVEEAPVSPACSPDHLPCSSTVCSYHGECAQRPGSALAHNAEVSFRIRAKCACRDHLRGTRESVAGHNWQRN